MSKRSLAPRSRSRKSAKVVPIRPLTPLERAHATLQGEAEVTTWYLRGLRSLLDAWSVYEGQHHLFGATRDHALGCLGMAAEGMAQNLEAHVNVIGEIRSGRQLPKGPASA